MSAGSNSRNRVLRTGLLERGDRAVDRLIASAQVVFVGQLAEDAAEGRLVVPFRQVDMTDDGDFLADEGANGRGLVLPASCARHGDGEQQGATESKET